MDRRLLSRYNRLIAGIHDIILNYSYSYVGDHNQKVVLSYIQYSFSTKTVKQRLIIFGIQHNILKISFILKYFFQCKLSKTYFKGMGHSIHMYVTQRKAIQRLLF